MQSDEITLQPLLMLDPFENRLLVLWDPQIPPLGEIPTSSFALAT